MITIELSSRDKERIDRLIEQLEKHNSMTEDVLVSCNEAARLIGKTNKTITAMLKDGRLSKTTIGNSTGIRLSEIREKFPRRDAVAEPSISY